MIFSSSRKKVRYGALIDIGSGSVLVAIVRSDETKTYPEIIWSKREYSPLRNVKSMDESAKQVMTSLVNGLMLLDSEGRKFLNEQTGHTELAETQVTVAAPWSYTITKSIFYSHEQNFNVSEQLLEELIKTAHLKVDEDISEHEQAYKLGLKIINRSIIGLKANGYNMRLVNSQTANSLQVVEASTVVQNYLVTALNDSKDKVLPETVIKIYSFMMVFYNIVMSFYPESTELCLVDITYEATELGIVRDGILTYTTHIPYGSFSLAREIAAVLGTTLEEAFGYLKETDASIFLDTYSQDKRAEVEAIFTAYQNKLTNLFRETGDALSIPKRIYLHGNLQTESFYKNQVGEAAKMATMSSHAVYPISKGLLNLNYPKETSSEFERSENDTALLISAQFFHTRDLQTRFEHF